MLPHHSLPGDDRAVIDLAQLVGSPDPEPAHEMSHVLLVGAAGGGALLAGKPDLLLGDGGQGRKADELPGIDRPCRVGVVGHVGTVVDRVRLPST